MVIGVGADVLEVVVLAAGANALLGVGRTARRVGAVGLAEKDGTNWFIPALVNSRFGASGIRLADGTIMCCFDSKKSRNDCRISLDVICIAYFP